MQGGELTNRKSSRSAAATRLPGWLRRLADVGVLPSDSEETQIRKSVLVLSSSLMATLGVYLGRDVRGARPVALGRNPVADQLASAASIYAFAHERRYRLFRGSQLGMSLILPFALQWSLGGFATSSAVALSGDSPAQRVPCCSSARAAVPWFLAFAGLVAVSAGDRSTLAASAPDIPERRRS